MPQKIKNFTKLVVVAMLLLNLGGLFAPTTVQAQEIATFDVFCTGEFFALTESLECRNGEIVDAGSSQATEGNKATVTVTCQQGHDPSLDRSGQKYFVLCGGTDAFITGWEASGNVDSASDQSNTPSNTALTAGDTVNCGGVQIGFDVGCKATGNPITDYLAGVLSVLAQGVGVVITLMIVISGIQYTASGGNPEAVAKAKARLGNAVVALIMFIFATALLNFLIPGGLF